jgi:hypothetical protein
MEIEIGEVVRKENAPIEISVSFWDETKTAPQDLAEVTIFLRTDETNIFSLKTMALMKAQELIVHIASMALGKGDELLNDFILMYESLKGGVSGLEVPYSWPSPTPFEVPPHILDWREGDEITLEHKNTVADSMSHSFNLPPSKAAETRERYAQLPDSAIASSLAVIIATRKSWDADTFRRTFPKIALSDSMAVRLFLSRADENR